MILIGKAIFFKCPRRTQRKFCNKNSERELVFPLSNWLLYLMERYVPKYPTESASSQRKLVRVNHFKCVVYNSAI